MKLPPAYQNRMQALLQDDYPAYLSALEMEPVVSLRLNSAKMSEEDFLSSFPYAEEKVSWCDDGFYVKKDAPASSHVYHHLGVYYLQEASAMAPAAFLPVKRNDLVLDACSAPGGKSLKLALRIPDGTLVSNDISASRQKATLRSLERAGVRNAYVTAMDLTDLAKQFPKQFDCVLLDAPCSGEGMFRKDPSLIRSWEEKGPESYAPLQKDLILAAYTCLKPDGYLLYSTCTFEEKENEEVIQFLLDDCDDMSLIPLDHPDFEKGRLGLKECARLYPHKIRGEGHFLTLLKKKASETNQTDSLSAAPDPSLNRILEDPFFLHLKMPMKKERLLLRNGMLYLLPVHTLKQKGLRVLRSGLFLGEMTAHGFVPSQALAMALKEEEYLHVLALCSADINAQKYLRGESLPVSTVADGWYLVTIDHLPAGWARITKGVFKNRIDKGWRIV